ncbi:MAG: hypothetical protein A2504_02975 [Bdellovibrionales bacterium RIFOXYD12_FULL_39_22]|nr:MAG: hypothetical protein A2385_05690 [Bdellovibrionales bacterium RIFOXYB1_FULL_39_21]OFZ42245.1 MAG: hypothetical protein A2485_15720 [Bdellovibrionales bacterium RIFOXYC12_FULL_39_17]OFZ46663.1 MAG: hypothetical protein A2404_03950 [Bdellovibrionales bacterium RIFOXYC1_FULL_39_130]OFZ76060.1 MAG: hypothetical protein A2560_03200 [Bdellovibrionales bacterium RIFOXYD1_FULL_39_84]OFZ93044.1 MAG: hypothetical protein A2504_02975 [Bdellovibrionales bacterium RIFOXYD12_FULL_39_22]HLE09938.1 Fe
MKKISVLVAFLFGFFGDTVFAESIDIAKAIFVKGRVYFLCTSNPTDKEQRLKKDMALQDGCSIVVKASKDNSGLAIIGFGENFSSKMKITEESKVTISRKTHGTVGAADYRKIDSMVVGAGNLLINYVNSDKEKNKLEVKTAKASLGVRGTEFFTYVDKNGNTSMTVDSGVVSVAGTEASASGESGIMVEKGKGTIVAEDGTVPMAKELAWSKEVNWKVDPQEGELKHSTSLFASIEEQYKEWNKEIEAQKKRYQEDIDAQKKNIEDDLEEQKKALWGDG